MSGDVDVNTMTTEERITALPRFAPKSRSQRAVHRNRWRIGVLIEAVALIGLWYLISLSPLLPDSFLPPPHRVVEEMVALVTGPALWANAAFTMQNFLLGLLISIVIGVPIGMAIGGFEFMHLFLGPVVWALYAVPLLAIAPVIVLVFGLGAESKVLVVVLIAIFPVVINTMQGIRGVQPNLISAAKVFGGNRLQVVGKVMFPALLPYLFVALRLAVAGGIAGALLAEFVGSYLGLGLMLSQSAFVFNVARVLALVVIIVVIAVIALVIIQRVKVWLAPWAKDTYS